MSKINEQPTLFDVEKEKRQRKPHKRVSRNKKARMVAYCQFLSMIKMKIENNEPYNLKDLQTMFNVSKFPKSLLPQLAGVDITLDFATEWYNTKIAPYNNAKNEKQRQKKEAEELQPIEVEEYESTPSLAEVLVRIEQITNDYITSALSEIDKAKEIINKALNNKILEL